MSTEHMEPNQRTQEAWGLLRLMAGPPAVNGWLLGARHGLSPFCMLSIFIHTRTPPGTIVSLDRTKLLPLHRLEFLL